MAVITSAMIALLLSTAPGRCGWSPPRVPAFARDTIVVESASLEQFEVQYRAGPGGGAGCEDFLFGWLPGRLFEEVINAEAPADGAQVNGLLYLSGLEGGRWLNGLFAAGGGPGIGPGPLLWSLRLPALAALDHRAARRNRLMAQGSKKAKAREVAKAFDLLAQTYGYNRGYLLELLQHQPAGSSLPANYLTCDGLLGCNYPFESAVLTPLLPARDRLQNPPGPEWERLAKKLQSKLPSAIRRGEGVWSGLMAERGVTPEGYAALVEISVEYLMINEAVLLLAASGLAEGDEGKMERALAADTALSVWLGGYLIGLGDQEKTGIEPRMNANERG